MVRNSLSYCNAALPNALLICGKSIPNRDMVKVGLESLRWLADLQRSVSPDGHFIPIGSNGFYSKIGEEQDLTKNCRSANNGISCLEAFRITNDKNWIKEARRAFEWFLGRNDLNLSVYDPISWLPRWFAFRPG
jgi:hypothetical protein